MSSKEIGIEEARKRLGDLVTAARQGTDVILTRNGKPAARLVPVTEATMNLSDSAATVIARARQASGLTAPEFDMQIGIEGIGGLLGPLGNEVYRLANEDMPEVVAGADNRLDERDANHAAMWEALKPELEAYAAKCRERRYTGWSYIERGMGQPIRYAD